MTKYGIFDMECEELNTIGDFIRYKSEQLLTRIGKLKLGQSVQGKPGTYRDAGINYGKFTCITRGESPRMFSVTDSAILPPGKYSFKTIRDAIEVVALEDNLNLVHLTISSPAEMEAFLD
jgi:hypothetical protein